MAGMGPDMEAYYAFLEREKQANIDRVNAQPTGPRAGGGTGGGTNLQLPPWMSQPPSQGTPPPQQSAPQPPPRTSTPPLKQLALHKRAPKSDSQALSQALRQGA